jgi:hypothetical protein
MTLTIPLSKFRCGMAAIAIIEACYFTAASLLGGQVDDDLHAGGVGLGWRSVKSDAGAGNLGPRTMWAGERCGGRDGGAATARADRSDGGALGVRVAVDGDRLPHRETGYAGAGVKAHGGSMIGPGPAIAGGWLYVNSGCGLHAGRGGNVLLAFSTH